ncbi:MAG TPA: fructosamine kinase family protein [Solirubrobacteraceae bacterium]|nr:fructosamine kinase family protein [Solirubrobacteraceae bacterium]
MSGSPLPPRIAGRAVVGARRAGGGSINDAYRVELEGGASAFVKTRADAAPGEYAAEAAGLAWLTAGGARVPAVLEAADGFLALEWLDEGQLDATGEEELGRMLATTHAAGADAFGAPAGELRIGPIVLPDAPTDDWARCYAERRLLPLLPRAGLSTAGARAAEQVCARMGDLTGPPEPPARLHGDLWSGNVLASDGRPFLIDPAAYGGHREVDLAMLQLFGTPSPRTLAAYDEVHPRAEGHEDRVALWQLFPLLVHAVLFGGGYVDAVERAARRYL